MNVYYLGWALPTIKQLRLAIPALLFALTSTLNAASKPNILLIIADDLNTSLHCYGNSVVQSPNIDRLAARGVRFGRAYCQYPVCNPSRSSFLAGLHPQTINVFNNGRAFIPGPADPPILPHLFHDNGYYTIRVGKIFHDSKWMLDGKPMRTTDDPKAWDISEDEAFAPEENDEAPRRRPPAGQGTGEPRRWVKLDIDDAATGDGQVARRAAQLMEQHARDDKPFFIAAGFRKPHLPWIAPKKYFELYPPEKIQPTEEPPEHLKRLLPIAVNRSKTDEAIPRAEAQQSIAAYYACVSFIDAQVGVILDTLDRLKLADNTIVIFTSDHGFHLGEHAQWGKSTLFEESARVPLIIVWPGTEKRNITCNRIVEMLDIYPTVADLTSQKMPPKLQGRSLQPLLKDPAAPWDKPACTVLKHDRILGRSIRTERYRYTEWQDEQHSTELYDHDADPHEFNNLAVDPKSAAVVAEMKAKLNAALPQ